MPSYNVKSNKKSNKLYIAIGTLLILASLFLVWFNNFTNQKTVETPIQKNTEIAQKKDESGKIALDYDGAKLTTELQKIGLRLGFIGSDLYKELGYNFPVTALEEEKNQLEEKYGSRVPLETIVKSPETLTNTNRIIWPEYEIDAPIEYASFEDIFTKKSETNNILYDDYIDNNPIDSPVQLKLRNGVVHLPFSPAPGEEGNSYIIGHSSNYNNVKSDYNYVFSKIVDKVKVGEVFKIFDHLGRELNFKVIETKVVAEKDAAEAYKNYNNKRTVTLQGSILETINGKLFPTKRYLVIAELDVV